METVLVGRCVTSNDDIYGYKWMTSVDLRRGECERVGGFLSSFIL